MHSHFSEELKDLLKKLLQKNPTERPNASQAMDHIWFKNVKDKPQEGNEELRAEILERLIAFQGKSKLKTAALNMLVKQQAESKHNIAQSVFARIDTDKTGYIDRKELKDALETSDKLKGKDDKD